MAARWCIGTRPPATLALLTKPLLCLSASVLSVRLAVLTELCSGEEAGIVAACHEAHAATVLLQGAAAAQAGCSFLAASLPLACLSGGGTAQRRLAAVQLATQLSQRRGWAAAEQVPGPVRSSDTVHGGMTGCCPDLPARTGPLPAPSH